jgi:superfamily I DNA and/or RNA helicase
VLALYPAQAELIRRMVRQTSGLATPPFALEIDVPRAFRQREADLVLLSLTRSHTHRAVAFGEGPQLLALALTRARHKLILVGDPGTLIRRGQWDGPLEHLDEAAAARERALIDPLVHYLLGQGSHPGAFHLRPGNGT